MSLLLLLIGALVLYSSAYAFSVNSTVIGAVRWAIGGLTLLGIVMAWRNQPLWAIVSGVGIFLMLGLISLLAR